MKLQRQLLFISYNEVSFRHVSKGVGEDFPPLCDVFQRQPMLSFKVYVQFNVPTANAQCPYVLATLDSLQLFRAIKKYSQGAEEYLHSCLHSEGATGFSSQTSQK